MKDRCSKLDENSKAIVDDCIGQKTVGDFFLCPLEDIVEIENENSINEIELRISTPFGENQTRRYDKPYIWDENKFFPKLVKNHGYSEGNWNNIIGDELLLRYNNNKNQWHLACKAEHQVDREESQNIKSPVEEGSLSLSIHSVISEDTNSTIYYITYVLYLLSITSAILLFMPN